jgi:hypothetical protein
LRCHQLLDAPSSTSAEGQLHYPKILLSPRAPSARLRTHERVERALPAGEDFADIRNVIAEATENVTPRSAVPCAGARPQRRNRRRSGRRYRDRNRLALHEACHLLSDLDALTVLVTAIRFDYWLTAEGRGDRYSSSRPDRGHPRAKSMNFTNSSLSDRFGDGAPTSSAFRSASRVTCLLYSALTVASVYPSNSSRGNIEPSKLLNQVALCARFSPWCSS